MVAVAKYQFDTDHATTTLVTQPTTADHRSELEELAAQLQLTSHHSDEVFFVTEVSN